MFHYPYKQTYYLGIMSIFTKKETEAQRNKKVVQVMQFINRTKIPNYLFDLKAYALSTTPILFLTRVSCFKNKERTLKCFSVTEY